MPSKPKSGNLNIPLDYMCTERKGERERERQTERQRDRISPILDLKAPTLFIG